MNTNILKRCIDELAKDAPDISYIRGALETLLELGRPDMSTSIVTPILPPISSQFTAKADEEELTPAQRAYLGNPGGIAPLA